MAKVSEKIDLQTDLFPEKPKIHGLAITDFKTSGAEIKATVVGVTNVNDVAKLDKECWKSAIASWMLALHDGDVDKTWLTVNQAYQDYINHYPESIHQATVVDFKSQ